MSEGRRVETLLAEGRREEAREMLDGASGPYAHLLRLWMLERPRGPGHVTSGLRDWEPPAPEEPDHARALCLAAALRAVEALRRADGPSLDAELREAVARLPSDAPWLAFVVAAVAQAAYRARGDTALAGRTLELCRAVGDRTDLPGLAVQARALAGSVHMLQGRFHRAEDQLLSSVELARARDLEGEAETGMTLQFRGYLRYEWNRLDEAHRFLLRAADAGEAAESRGILSGVYRMLMQVELARHDRDEAELWLGRLEAVMSGPLSERNREWISSVRAGFHASVGELKKAAELVRRRGYRPRELAGAAPEHILGRLPEMVRLLDVLGALHRWEEARVLARAVRGAAREAERRWFAVRAGAWEASALESLGRPDEADAVLAEAAPTVEDEGYVRVLADLGAPVVPVLTRAGPGLVRALQAARLQAEGRRRRPALTDREREVLGLLARGSSTKAIARELGVSVATVKTHLHNLYRKLDVSSRTQALARAEALALI